MSTSTTSPIKRRLRSSLTSNPASLPSTSTSPAKRAPTSQPSPHPKKPKRSSLPSVPPPDPLPSFNLPPAPLDPARVIPANLTFDFERGKRHLIGCDPRFERLFGTVRCRPFEALEPVDPFRSLCTSIIGQQVSWLAARSINHKFRRLFDPLLPEKHTEDSGDLGGSNNSFPTPEDVLKLDIPQLRSAGLSGRKAEYVQSLARHFVSGQLSVDWLAHSPVEEVSKALIGVRGIGQWTVDMFLIFTLKRPDILPIGDLGVQKGLGKWVLAAFDRREVDGPLSSLAKSNPVQDPREDVEPAQPSSTLPLPSPTPVSPKLPPLVEPGSSKKTEQKGLSRGLLAYDPHTHGDPGERYPWPPGMDVGTLRSRLAGKKAKGNVYLTGREMEDLTERWKPYRSLGVFYMWAVAEETS